MGEISVSQGSTWHKDPAHHSLLAIRHSHC